MTAAPKRDIVQRDVKPENDQLADDVLDVPAAAELLKVGRDAIYAMCARQQIPHRKIGRVLRFSRAALIRWLDSSGSVESCGPAGAQKEAQ